ncbi:hypothetical protein HKD37_20G056221 [Glycine soja]
MFEWNGGVGCSGHGGLGGRHLGKMSFEGPEGSGEALVRVQAHIKPRNVGNSQEGKSANERCNEADPVKQAEQGWCDIPRTVEEVKAKLQMRQEGAIKRDRTKAYSQSKMVLRFFLVRVSATQLLAFFCYP